MPPNLRPTSIPQNQDPSDDEGHHSEKNHSEDDGRSDAGSDSGSPTLAPRDSRHTTPEIEEKAQPLSRADISRLVSHFLNTDKRIRVKVFKIQSGGRRDADNGAVPLASIDLEKPGSSWAKRKLKDLRLKLGTIQETFSFCEEDSSVVSEAMTLSSYFKSLDTPITQDGATLRLFIKGALKEAEHISAKEVFTQSRFLLKFAQILPDGELQNEGSLHSSSLKGHDLGEMHMGDVRKLIKSMSQDPQKHTFCFKDGTSISDDVPLEEYVSTSNEGFSTNKDETPVVVITFQKAGKKSRFTGADERVLSKLESLDINAKLTERSDMDVQRDKTAFRAADHEQLKAEDLMVQSADISRISDMDENDWFKVLRNCNLMFGWKVDPKSHSIVRAPKAAFQLRPGVNMPKEDPNFPKPIKKVIKSPRKRSSRHATFSQFGRNTIDLWGESDYDDSVKGSDDDAEKSGADSEEEGREDNDDDDDDDDKPRRRRRHRGRDSDDSEVDGEEKSDAEDSEGDYGDDDDEEEEDLDDNDSAVEKSTMKKPTTTKRRIVKRPLPEAKKPPSFPSFIVNDNSRVEVVMVSHEFQESMAANHFSSNSVEASVSGGYAGFSAAASAGVGKESSQGSSSSKKGFEKKMIASYKYPRATVFVRPEDLEPTQDLKDAIEVVKTTKNINALRHLHATFGNLFCQQVVIGGCLQTSKTTSGTEQSSEFTQKEQFKASVGVAVQTPIGVGGSVKAQHESGDASNQGVKVVNVNESMYFEATGGNTILASNPASWSASVGDYNNWRVIEQSELCPLIDVLSDIAEYTHVREWFLAAVPALSNYIVIPDSRSLNVRLRVCMEQGAIARIAGKKTSCYFAHDPSDPVWPRRMGATWTYETVVPRFYDMTLLTTQFNMKEDYALFTPTRTQAPTLRHLNDHYYGDKLDPDFKYTVWQFDVPEGFSLSHGSRVMMKSRVVVQEAKDGKPEQSFWSSLTVYRNRQGIFLPCMTASDEPSYWRVEKQHNDSSDEDDDIKEGDAIRLVWHFEDQHSGFRDFFDDAFGRRRTTKPDGVGPALYLKVPYPRFEPTDSPGIALVLSDKGADGKFVMEPTRVLQMQKDGNTLDSEKTDSVTYQLHDLVLRLDTVGNGGKGDTSDYMMAGLDQTLYLETRTSGKQTTSYICPPRPPSPPQILANILGAVIPGAGFLQALFL